MQVSFETLEGLERKLTISVPAEKVEEEVGLRLRDLARKVKVDGFRPGKAPLSVVKQRFTDSVLEEVAQNMIQPTLFEALKERDLLLAGDPSVNMEQLELGKEFKYSATFEVFPTFEIKELSQAEVEQIRSEVKDSDVDAMLDKLRDQNKQWVKAERAAADGDKAVIDFEGFLNDEPFEGGTAKGYEIELGSNSMIPGFESGIVGSKAGETFDIKVTFPEDYGHQPLAGKEATFKITTHEVLEGKKAELNDAFAEQFNIKEGGVEALRKDIKENMVRELERRVNAMNREILFNELLKVNAIDVPKSLVDKEIEGLKHEMYHRIFGNEHSENEKIPDFPRELFEEQAIRRVQLGLLFAEYVKKHEVTATKERVNETIERFASAYERPDDLREWYRGDKERMAEIEGLVMEDMVAEKIASDAKLKDKSMTYDEVMNPKKESTTKGE